MQSVKTEQKFSEILVGKLNDAAICLMISIGHRTGLFDQLAEMEHATSSVIASAAKLNERYVREWLDSMTVAGIIEFKKSDKTYFLPKEHAAILTRTSGNMNFAVMAQFIGMMGSVEDRIVDCFHNGGGVDYSAFERFHEIMAEDSGQTVLPHLVETIIPIAPGLHDRLEEGISVVDIGCGRGRAIRKLAKVYPKSKFTGFDLCEDAVEHGKKEIEEEGLKNVDIRMQDVAKLADKNEYDLITAFDAIHDQAKPDVVLKNIYNALKPNGIFLMQDIGVSSDVEQNKAHPLAPLVYTISCMHCMTVSLAQDGAGLGAAWGRELASKMIKEAGFDKQEIHDLEHDPLNCFFVATK